MVRIISLHRSKFSKVYGKDLVSLLGCCQVGSREKQCRDGQCSRTFRQQAEEAGHVSASSTCTRASDPAAAPATLCAGCSRKCGPEIGGPLSSGRSSPHSVMLLHRFEHICMAAKSLTSEKLWYCHQEWPFPSDAEGLSSRKGCIARKLDRVQNTNLRARIPLHNAIPGSHQTSSTGRLPSLLVMPFFIATNGGNMSVPVRASWVAYGRWQ